MSETTTYTRAQVDQAVAAATAGERDRFKGIMSSEAAKGRESAALGFAVAGMSVEIATAALAGIPKSGEANPGNSLGLFVAPQAKPNTAGPKGDHGWGDVIAEMNKRG